MAAARKSGKKGRQVRGARGARNSNVRPPAAAVGRRVILQIDIRPELKRVLQARALATGMTLQAYVLSILRDAGLPVRRSDLLDRRKHENRVRKPMPANSRRPRQRSAMKPSGLKSHAPGPELLERLGLDGIEGVGQCIIVVNVDGGRLRKNKQKRVAKSGSRRQLARRRKSK